MNTNLLDFTFTDKFLVVLVKTTIMFILQHAKQHFVHLMITYVKIVLIYVSIIVLVLNIQMY